MASRFQILSLSGGGARGLYTAQVLAELENRFKKPIAKHVDLICGTSIGGILALGLAAHIPAEYILSTFDKHRKSIFPDNKPWKKKGFIFGLSPKDISQLKKSQYSSEPLKKAVEEIYEGRKVKDLKSCVLVPAINYTVGKMRVFKTPHHHDFYQDQERTLSDVALATSAAPTYFPIHAINGERYVDGGLTANNPIQLGIIEAFRAFQIPLDSISGLCIGNMGQGLSVNHENALDLGYLGWGFGQDIIDLSMSVNEQLSFDMARMLLNGRLYQIDSDATEQQAQLLKLDNGSDAAAEILRAHARNKAGEQVNTPEIIEFFQHSAKALPTYSVKDAREVSNAKV